MSVKAMAAAWDLECPKMYGDREFRPSHKLTLLAYTDHADHYGKNIFPAVKTVAKKTGYNERTVQRLTDDLLIFGMLIEDDKGPRGTNKYYTPILEEGWHSVTLADDHPGTDDNSSGDIPSGDIPSGDTVPPEFKEPEPDQIIINKHTKLWNQALKKIKDELPKAPFETWVECTEAIGFDGKTLTVAARNQYARDWLTNRVTEQAQMATGVFVKFVVHENGDGEEES